MPPLPTRKGSLTYRSSDWQVSSQLEDPLCQHHANKVGTPGLGVDEVAERRHA
jgi:hypothetical protein